MVQSSWTSPDLSPDDLDPVDGHRVSEEVFEVFLPKEIPVQSI